ncbi:MAG: LPP20 family lipoprotein [Nitrospirae bacterium]|nr:LPP20 family lipoprotein [Nitrospirota bacterium]
MKFFAALIIVPAFLTACQTSGGVKTPINPAPDWVVRNPNIEGIICAVGASEPTYYREDAKLYAAENARKELARTISVDIKTIMIDIGTKRGSRVDEATVTEVSSWATSAAVENSKIIEYWHDEEGAVSGKKNVTYALSCMPRRFDKRSLEAQLSRSGKSDLKEISRTADEIIRQLEEEK